MRRPRAEAIHQPTMTPALFLGLALLLTTGCTGSKAQDEPKSAEPPAATADPSRAEGEPNKLAGETSPYLLQHAHNPVNWHPWGPEAFEKARAEDKPIFLSVGYSSCYWCHVMERESFENEKIASFLNEHFICIKVDREERPDVDQVYMTAVQAITGGGGWPMSVFLTPEGKPFYGGTYFPPEPRDGMPGFLPIIEAIAQAWDEQRAALEEDAERLTSYVRRVSGGSIALEKVPLDRRLATQGLLALAESFDPEYGGFSYDPERPNVPKFPEPTNLVFLLEQHRRGRARGDAMEAGPLAMVESTLAHMARGGIRDHLGGGYHRYSTDRFWAIPHFEKMLYDNAQLVSVHLLAFEITGDDRWKREAEATLGFIAEVMTSPDGAFFSALDAETDAEEGKYYVWTKEQVRDVLGDGENVDLFLHCYGLDREPNFEGGRHVLLRPEPPVEQAAARNMTPESLDAILAPMRAKLLAARRDREMPFKDDKVLTSWNALMIAAYADAFRVLDEPRYKEAAEIAASFLLTTLRDDEGRLLRTYRAGTARLPAYLEDYAYLIHALLRLHKATGEQRWLDEARVLADRMIDDFADEEAGGFFFTADDQESLVARVKDPYDAALPGPNAVAIRDLIALHHLTGEASYLDIAGQALEAFAPAMERSPAGLPLMLVALEEYLDARNPAPKDNAPDHDGDGDDDGDAAAFAPGRLRPDPDALAAPAPDSNIVSARVALATPDAVAAEEPIEVRIHLTIKAPYHLNANPAGAGNLIPTALTIAPGSPAELLDVSYPAGESKTFGGLEEPIPVYEGTVTLTARIRLPDRTPPGPITVPLRLRYQACNDRACLAPDVLTLAVSTNIK